MKRTEKQKTNNYFFCQPISLEVTIHNPVEYEAYQKLTPPSWKAYEGTFIVRGGKTEMPEGDWNPERTVILEFPDMERQACGGILRNMHQLKHYDSAPFTLK